ncbi:hypothetical protein [Terracidiphilus sp.]|jgi:hypothetical protein|uniref:hypothetical protein n=1 Tax=Terracidiphilus sp. TaxID=1964191 RepID=UPI003C297C03
MAFNPKLAFTTGFLVQKVYADHDEQNDGDDNEVFFAVMSRELKHRKGEHDSTIAELALVMALSHIVRQFVYMRQITPDKRAFGKVAECSRVTPALFK